jgi:repressor LexA
MHSYFLAGHIMRPPLTERQQQMLDYIEHVVTTTGFPPSIRQIGEALHISSTNGVRAHLKALEKKGYIHRSLRTSRGIAMLDRVKTTVSDAVDTIAVPILGRVTAGTPILAVENHDSHLILDPNLVNGDDVFALRVEGDSMIEAGILDGDYVLVRRQESAANGDIVVALLEDDEVTVKRFFREANGIRLQPENQRFEPIHVSNVSICGKVTGLIRTSVH